MPPTHIPPKRWENHLGHLLAELLNQLLPSPNIGTACHHRPPTKRSKQAREPIVSFHCTLLQQGPSKALPEFLVWPLINFY